ncbi:MFS transporter [Microbacterium album]|uniref:MFS transporter n=1 Tax=Microbacterium album TaxID=2053191 RepID=A0A917ICY1_9MICO|nr:MFS transporter [Microbacterium album]GGH35898.1 MFS transporter [Microbacterium album]
MTSPSRRMDDLPFTRKHLRLLTGSGVGWALDAMDVGLISFIIAALAVEWDLTRTETSWIASVGFIGMAIGASLGGLLADRLGRRQVFALTLLVYGIATGASALVGGVAALLVLRFLVGLGLGSELPVASTYVSEFAPSRIRGRLVVILEAFWAVGWTAAAVIGYFVVPLDEGWRWAFAIGAVPAVYAIVVRWALPESPRFLENKGRIAEAEAIVRDFERAAGRTHDPRAEPRTRGEAAERGVERADTQPAAPKKGRGLAAVAQLWVPGMRRRTAALWVVWFCVNFSYYGAFIWIPSILVAQGYELVASFGFTLIITLAQLPGYAAAAWLIEVWGRRATLSVFLIGSAVSALCFGNAGEEWQIIAAGMALSFFNLGAWGALYAVSPELYPTSVRATGAGWAAGVGRIASIVAPLFVAWALDLGGAALLFAVFSAFFVIAALAVIPLADRKGVPLDDERSAHV